MFKPQEDAVNVGRARLDCFVYVFRFLHCFCHIRFPACQFVVLHFYLFVILDFCVEWALNGKLTIMSSSRFEHIDCPKVQSDELEKAILSVKFPLVGQLEVSLAGVPKATPKSSVVQLALPINFEGHLPSSSRLPVFFEGYSHVKCS